MPMPSHPISGEAAKRSSRFLSCLRLFNCPLVEDLDEARFADLALHPCEWRQRLLVWLLGEMDATLGQSVSAQKGALTPALLDHFSGLGLCGPEREDLVSGVARRLDQLAFFAKLLRVVYLTRYQAVAKDSASDSDIVDASLRLMNGRLAEAPLTRMLTATSSYLPPEWGLHFRAQVEKRRAAKAEVEPLAWRVAAWENEVKEATRRQEEALQRLPRAEFTTAAESAERAEALRRLSAGVERFVGAHRRVFKAACDQRRVLSDEFADSASARRQRAAEVEEFGATMGRLRERLAAVGAMAEGARRMEEEMGGMVVREEEEPVLPDALRLVEEVRRADAS